MIEGLLKSDFVARLAEKDWVKRNITEQCITLQLQLHSVKGTLTLNVPPSPSDRSEHKYGDYFCSRLASLSSVYMAFSFPDSGMAFVHLLKCS